MWMTFALATLVACLVLFLPGYCLFRALGFSRIVALCAGPVGSIFGISGLTTCFGLAGIPTNAATVTMAIAVICAGLLGISRFLDVRQFSRVDVVRAAPITFAGRSLPFDPVVLAGYVVYGVLVCTMVFIPCLTGSPDALFCRWDNQTHMNTVRAFLDVELWSTLSTSYYLGVDPSANPYSNSVSSGFYPAGWHILCAYVCSATNTSVPLGANALNAVISSVVYPAGMFLLLKAIFPQNRLAIAAGAVITMMFTAFPWALYVKGPLYPSLISNAVLPALLGAVVLFFEQELFPRRWILLAITSFIGLAALVITQTSAVFAVYIFLAAYGAHYFYRHLNASRFSRAQSRLIIGCYLAVIVAFWTFCYNLPFLQDIVQYVWASVVPIPLAIAMAGTFAMPSFMPEFLLGFVALIGLLSCIKHKRYWIIFPALVMMIAFILDRSTSGFLKSFISGFWYTDAFRTAALYAIFVVPVAALGFAAIFRWLRERVSKESSLLKRDSALFAVMVIVLCVVTYLPSFTLPVGKGLLVETAFGSLHERFLDSYRTDAEQVLSTEERAFIERALEVIPPGSLVINQPCDGSVFAFGTNDLNTYYRSCRAGTQNDIGKSIRRSLVDYAKSDTVQDAVESTGAEYLLQLDQGVAFDEGVWLPQYEHPEDWTGIDDIRDDTPGFTVVLSEGDMRLYKIG